MNKPIRKAVTAGLLVRRPMRRLLLSLGIDFTEDKGWLDSVFYLHCNDLHLAQLKIYLSKYAPHE